MSILISPADGVVSPGTSITFQWSAVEGAIGYRLSVIKISDNSSLVNIEVGNFLSYTVFSFPADGTQYKWSVTAIMGEVTAPYQNFTSGAAIPLPPPGSYYPASISVLQGQLASGSAASLAGKDGSFLTIGAVPKSTYNFVNWTADFKLPIQKVSKLVLSYSGRYTTWIGQNLYLYNWTTASWQSLDYRAIGPAGATLVLATIANPTSLVAADGTVRARVYSYSYYAYTASADYLALGVTF